MRVRRFLLREQIQMRRMRRAEVIVSEQILDWNGGPNRCIDGLVREAVLPRPAVLC